MSIQAVRIQFRGGLTITGMTEEQVTDRLPEHVRSRVPLGNGDGW
ncbi:hypothetical protein [Kutzneria sp. CA-103260]|nr:hypothetical protein [Kutzneria sp. CA-103260]